MTQIKRFAIASVAVAITGLAIAVGLLLAIHFDAFANTSPVWVAIAVLVFQLPALAMGLISRTSLLGRAGIILASAVLVALLIGTLLLWPTSVEKSSDGDIPGIEEAVGCDPHSAAVGINEFKTMVRIAPRNVLRRMVPYA